MRKFDFTNNQQPEDVELISDQIIKLLRNIHFGSIEIIVHDGKVVQIEKHEKFRLNSSAPVTSGHS